MMIRRYNSDDAQLWDNFVREARNSSLLSLRTYMDYHSDRFHDHSLIAYKGTKPIALLPANLTPDGTLHSHQGLTFGGWILPPRHVDGVDIMELFEESISYMRREGIIRLDYKPTPVIYHTQPSEEEIYALLRLGAQPTGYNLSEAIRLRHTPGLNTLRRRQLRKAALHPTTITEATPENGILEAFYAMLEECLKQRHGAKPVHTLAELRRLQQLHPENIRIHAVIDGAETREDRPEAGALTRGKTEAFGTGDALTGGKAEALEASGDALAGGRALGASEDALAGAEALGASEDALTGGRVDLLAGICIYS
ncbi:MAG: hypothetical protein K2F64_02465, partial [Muribaculaceae bacterium]|nr:hypothetical protein [Muribaculaceae bacterium]